MFCFECGKKIIDGAKFCPFCGANMKKLYEEEAVSHEDNAQLIEEQETDVEDNKFSSDTEVDAYNTDDEYADDDEQEDEDDEYDNDDDQEEDDDEYDDEESEQNNLVLYKETDSDGLRKHYLCDGKFVLHMLSWDLTFSRKMEYVINLNSAYNDLATKASLMIKDVYEKAGNIETAIKEIQDQSVNILSVAANDTLKCLGLFEIYDMDAISVLTYNGASSRHRVHRLSPRDIWREALDEVCGAYNAINQEADNEKLNREIRKESRSRMQGMGFGLSGAIEAQMKAGAYNMATGAAHSLFNAVGNAMTDSDRNSKLKTLYESEEPKRILMYGIYNTIQQMKFDAIAMCGLEEMYNRQGIQKAETIIQNIRNGAVPESKVDSVLVDLFIENPFDERLYKMYLDRFGDNDYELSLFARFFDMEDCVARIKEDILLDKIEHSIFITNKDAIKKLISDDDNTNWTDLIEDESEISDDINALGDICDYLKINNTHAMAALKLVERNIANEEGILTNELLAEIIAVKYKLNSHEEAYTYEIPKFNVIDIVVEYCLDVKKIAENTFSGFEIAEILLDTDEMVLELEPGAFRNAKFRKIDCLWTENIPAFAFEGCQNLETVDFLYEVKNINDGAFNHCDNLKLIVLPKTVMSIADNICDKEDVVYECYDRNAASYKICTDYGWNVQISAEARAFEEGQKFEQQGDYEQAFQKYKVSAEADYIEAYEYLARCYYNAAGTEQNFNEAFKYFKLAADDANSAVCMHTIGFMYQNGQGTEANLFKAMQCYLEAGKNGVAWSMNAMGMIYYQGLGGKVNLAEAAKWFSKAAAAGDETAKSNLEQLLAQNTELIPAKDRGDDDYDIKYVARQNISAFTKFLFSEFDKQAGSGIYYYDTSEKAATKFKDAMAAYVPSSADEIPMICYDHTFWGGAEDGCIITNSSIYIHNNGEDNQHVQFKQIVKVETVADGVQLKTESSVCTIAIKSGDTAEKLMKIINMCIEYLK